MPDSEKILVEVTSKVLKFYKIPERRSKGDKRPLRSILT